MVWKQCIVSVKAPKRGYHIITSQILNAIQNDLKTIKIGLCHCFIQHTSAALTINENADRDVRHDFEEFMNRLVPENEPYYKHTTEGSDDMPAHIKSSLLGPSVTIPISNGELALGTWQGIYLCEFRNYASTRKIVVTLQGE